MSLDLTSAAYLKNPVPTFDKLRQRGAVVRIKLPLVGKVWLTTTHAATSALLKDNQRFAMRKPGRGTAAGVQWWMPKSLKILANNMLTSDNPDHQRLRGLVDQAFQRRPIRDLENGVRETARALLRDCDKTGGFNLVTDYARKLPIAVISQLLGLEGDAQAKFFKHASSMTGVSGMMGFLRLLPSIGAMSKEMRRELKREAEAQKSGNPGKGLISELVRVENGGDRLSEDELLAMVFLLLMAGSETTTHMVSLAVHTLEEKPERKAAFLAAQDNPLAIEELLRFCAPVQFSKPRYVLRSGEFHGSTLQEGDLMMAGLAIANRDPAVFDQPDRLNLNRKPNPHLEFGTGIHFCLGFQLARLEIQCGLQELYHSMPDLEIAEPPKWRKGVGIRGPSELIVRRHRS